MFEERTNNDGNTNGKKNFVVNLLVKLLFIFIFIFLWGLGIWYVVICLGIRWYKEGTMVKNGHYYIQTEFTETTLSILCDELHSTSLGERYVIAKAGFNEKDSLRVEMETQDSLRDLWSNLYQISVDEIPDSNTITEFQTTVDWTTLDKESVQAMTFHPADYKDYTAVDVSEDIYLYVWKEENGYRVSITKEQNIQNGGILWQIFGIR